MDKYYVTVGLEIHAELKTKTKMFCACKNDPEELEPNKNICPVCMAHPGALPVANKNAIENVIKIGLALRANISNFSEFDRKNYFYPDIPKGYQISQYKYPIVSGGSLANFDITRVHLEEDTANNKHSEEGYSLIDFNRAGVPLSELVTEAHTFESAKEAALAASHFAKEYQLLLWYIDASEANMEKGEMRVEANVSVSKDRDKLSDAYVELKNLNSFKSVEKAILYEVDRMVGLNKEGRGSEIVKETRGWDESGQKTFSQRRKESSEDYRYFPDPDLPKMKLSEIFDFKAIEESLPELPKDKRKRFKESFGIKEEDIESYILDRDLGQYFEKLAKDLKDKEKIKLASNYITSDFLGLKKKYKEVKLPSVHNFKELVELAFDKKISSRVAKDILFMIAKEDASPLGIAKSKSLLQQNDEGSLKGIVNKILEENPKVVEEYKAGKENVIMFLVGQVMRETKGAANPELAKELLFKILN